MGDLMYNPAIVPPSVNGPLTGYDAVIAIDNNQQGVSPQTHIFCIVIAVIICNCSCFPESSQAKVPQAKTSRLS